MATEAAYLAGVVKDDTLARLIEDIESAASRARKAEPGDRTDIARFEALMTRLEQRAAGVDRAGRLPLPDPAAYAEVTLVGDDPARWPGEMPASVRAAATAIVARGLVPVLVVEPLDAGVTARPGDAQSAPDPAERWDAGGARGRRAVEARFRAQICEALSGPKPRPIAPSGINNSVVTEMLREFADAEPGVPARRVPVEYRDGSRSANPMPLRALPLRGQLEPSDLTLRFALLSIRHTEMDAVVDGAWLRNAEISRPRPAAQTDDLVYDITRQQLDELARHGSRVRLDLYQTGLETAVVGFYKALADHLLAHPRSVAVQPMYYDGASPAGERDRSAGITVDSAPFRKGTPWTM
ncbi:hypothetical protein [Micromonospora sp. D75]|uniref:hypothetical protein n=1 Tax=Micromonospora sp. D75 TaxID=2824885 RepID=UPI001B386E08|nr:hypothetical protein [Micromonospora sp. D75]MBQ1065216.1 hypothetical protein [Micromonospora sp. D75]